MEAADGVLRLELAFKTDGPSLDSDGLDVTSFNLDEAGHGDAMRLERALEVDHAT